MYKIGEFSKLARTTIKTLRYYEQAGLLDPSFVDENGYRYYEGKDLIILNRIMSLRQMNFSIEEIKKILDGKDLQKLLTQKKNELESISNNIHEQISKINYLLKENKMNYEVSIKTLPECTVYYKEGYLKKYSDSIEFILSSADECLKDNPNIKCIEPDYCFMEYLDNEYKEENIHVRYSQAVIKEGKENETIKFRKISETKAVCILYKGTYNNIGDAYAFLTKYIEDNKLEAADCFREVYIDGPWNKEKQEDYLTEIEVPIK